MTQKLLAGLAGLPCALQGQTVRGLAFWVVQATLEAQVYPHVATGFGDSNAYLRELTLKSMLVLAPKLSQKTLNQSLLKFLAKLQARTSGCTPWHVHMQWLCRSLVGCWLSFSPVSFCLPCGLQHAHVVEVRHGRLTGG